MALIEALEPQQNLFHVYQQKYSLTFSCLKKVEIGLGLAGRCEQIVRIIPLRRQNDRVHKKE